MLSRQKMKHGSEPTAQQKKAEEKEKNGNKPIAKKSAKKIKSEKQAKKPLPVRQKVSKKSAKRKKEDRVYEKEARAYLASHPVCEAQIAEGCTRVSCEIHHKRKRNSKDDRINPENFLAVDRACHLWIESHPKKAQELGLSESHLKSKK